MTERIEWMSPLEADHRDVAVWRCRRCGWDSDAADVASCAICGSGLGERRVRRAALCTDDRPSTGRRCAGPGCSELVLGRGDRKYHSDACRVAAHRVRVQSASRTRSRGSGTAMADPPLAVTDRDPSPLVDDDAAAPVIADTADIPATPDRRCANCGRDISAKRKIAVVCGDACRKALARRARQIAGQAELSDLLGAPPVADVDTGGRL